mgnify:CR=1 FL=1
MRFRALAAALALAACVPAPSDDAPRAEGLTLVPAARGIDVAPTGQEIGFGRHRVGTVAAVARVLGRAPDGVGAAHGCDLSAATWGRDGLTMYFAGPDAAFVGWRAGGGRTFAGVPESAGRTC